MSKELKQSYELYRKEGFILNKTLKNKKFSPKKGEYQIRENEEFDSGATGYAGIIPPELIIFDNDSYKDGGESFARLLEDLGIEEWEIKPFAVTTSGGYHYAIRNKYPDKVVGIINGESGRYPKVDIYAGYQSVIPIVGTTATNREGKIGSYKWYDDDLFYVNDWIDGLDDVLEMRERVNSVNEDYDEDGLTLAVKEQDMPDEEVEELVNSIPNPDGDYDSLYLPIAQALYDRYEGGQRGLELFQMFSAKSNKHNEDYNEKKWESGHFKPTRSTYKKLRSLFNENNQLPNIEKAIDNITNDGDVEKLVEKLSGMSYINTRHKSDAGIRTDISNKINSKIKELNRNGAKLKVVQARTILKNITYQKPEMTNEEIKEQVGDLCVYMRGKDYLVRINSGLYTDLSSIAANKILMDKAKLDETTTKSLVAKPTCISKVIERTDYTIKNTIQFNIKNEEGVDNLIVYRNPLHNISNYIDDEEVINDFFKQIWNGKAEDIAKLVGLSIRFKEGKLNRLMLVAPSNAGKSEVALHLGFQKINMPRLLSAMRGDKGIGAGIVGGLKSTGLLLIDEANKALEQDIKDMDKEIHIDQFGSGGTQSVQLHYTILTSTHKTATRNNSDELYNRFLQIELSEKEMGHKITDSEIFRRDTDHYTNVVQSYLLWVVYDAIHNEDYTKEDLHKLQERYRLPLNNDLDEFLSDVSHKVIRHIQDVAKDTGDIVVKGDKFYIKRKTDLSELIEDMLRELPHLDTGKYSERLVGHFLGDFKSVKIDGKPVKYYELQMKPFYLDETKAVIDMFDDLDEEEF